MGLTTGGPPPSGITWQALIFKQFGLSVDPELRMKQIPDAGFSLAVAPSLEMRPPSKFRLKLSPMIAMGGGSDTNAGFDFAVSPRMAFGKVQTTAMRLSVTPLLSMNGRDKERGAFALIAAPSLGMAGKAAILYDATGGSISSGASPGTFTESHTLGSAATAIIVAVAAYNGGGAPTVTAKIGTTSIPQRGTLISGTNTYFLFGLIGPPTGAQTISVTSVGGTPYMAASSVSYTHVASFGTVVTNSGSGATATQAVSAAKDQRVVQMFGCLTGNVSAYSQTQRINLPQIPAASPSLVIGDAVGAASLNFSATAASVWGSIAMPMLT